MRIRLLTFGLILAMLTVAALVYSLPREQATPETVTDQAQTSTARRYREGPPPRPTRAPKPVPTPEDTAPAATPSVPDPVLPSPSLSEELAGYLAGLDGTYGLAVRNPKDGQTILINADHVFPAASLYKLLVLYRVYQALDRGDLAADNDVVFESDDLVEAENGDGLSPGDSITVSQAVDWMIDYSSNPAAYALARAVGGWSEVVAAASDLGMKDTSYDGDSFVTTPADVLHFFDLLSAGVLVSPAASDEMMAILLQQQTNDRLPADLPPSVRVAHKTGELPEVRHDAGIVFGTGGSYPIAILSEGIDPEKAARAQAEISRIIYDRFNP